MPVDPRILEKSPLSPSQKDILRRIDILKESTTQVAKKYNVTKGTMSKRRSVALKRYRQFAALFKEIVADEVEKFCARLDELDSRIKDAFAVLESNAKSLNGLRFVVDQVGPSRVRDCVHNANGKCNKWPSLPVTPNTCGICVDFLDKYNTEAIDASDAY